MDGLSGLVSAVFSPTHDDGSLNLARVAELTDWNIARDVRALFVCGSTGEGASFTLDERGQVAEAYVRAAAGRVPVIVHVGHNCVTDATTLARHARDCGATAIAAAAPNYFKPATLDALIESLLPMAAAAPDLPFYYYHIPRLTGVDFDMVQFLEEGSRRMPSLAGLKYSDSTFDGFLTCVQHHGGAFDILFGCDEMLLSGLAAGAAGAVGSTYNFAAPLYQQVIRAFEAGEMEEARRYQGLAVQMVRAILRYPVPSALKATMGIVGVDCGPTRLPLRPLTTAQRDCLRDELASIEGLAEWLR